MSLNKDEGLKREIGTLGLAAGVVNFIVGAGLYYLNLFFGFEKLPGQPWFVNQPITVKRMSEKAGFQGPHVNHYCRKTSIKNLA